LVKRPVFWASLSGVAFASPQFPTSHVEGEDDFIYRGGEDVEQYKDE
jgi:hypothetical protein